MSTSSVAVPSYPAAAIPRAVNPWIVALAVVIPTFMEVLDTTIANVALRHIAGGLSAAVTDGEWVITSYLAANAIILPISGWLSIRLGRRNYFLLSILVFTIASALCGMATSLNMLIFSRILQGLAGGGLQPSSQGVLLDAFPKEKQGGAQTLFGIAALLAPVVGPTLGGYITDNYGWRWVFYINVPVGLIALVMCRALVFDPPYLKAQSAEARKQNRAFDTLGLSLLAVTMTSWEVLLSKGQEWDWFGDPFLRVQTLALLFVLGLGGLIVREMRYDNPLINFRTLKDRNFLVCCVIIFCAFAALYANTVSLPALLQSLFGYDATTSGLVLSPAGIFAIIVLAIVGRLLGRGVDARYLMASGLFILGVGGYWMSRLNLEISPVANCLAARRIHHGPLRHFCSAQRCRVHAHSTSTSRRCGRFARAFAQRRWQRRNFRCPDNSGAPRSIPHFATWRKSRSAQSGSEFLSRSSTASFSSANRRRGGRETNGATKSREFA